MHSHSSERIRFTRIIENDGCLFLLLSRIPGYKAHFDQSSDSFSFTNPSTLLPSIVCQLPQNISTASDVGLGRVQQDFLLYHEGDFFRSFIIFKTIPNSNAFMVLVRPLGSTHQSFFSVTLTKGKILIENLTHNFAGGSYDRPT